MAASPGEAARIYNQTSVPIYIFPGMCISGSAKCLPGQHLITIQPGQKSDSLNWTNVNAIGVMVGNIPAIVPLCGLDFGYRAQIQGGNYLIVDENNCTLYDSNQAVMQQEKTVLKAMMPGH
jgi:hypothetical protein